MIRNSLTSIGNSLIDYASSTGPLVSAAWMGTVLLRFGLFIQHTGEFTRFLHRLATGYLLFSLWSIFHGAFFRVSQISDYSFFEVIQDDSVFFRLFFFYSTFLLAIFFLGISTRFILTKRTIREFALLIFFLHLGGLFVIRFSTFIDLLIALEIITLGSYVIVSFERQNRFSTYAGIQYFLVGSIPSARLLLGFALFYLQGGSLVVQDLDILFSNSFQFNEGFDRFYSSFSNAVDLFPDSFMDVDTIESNNRVFAAGISAHIADSVSTIATIQLPKVYEAQSTNSSLEALEIARRAAKASEQLNESIRNKNSIIPALMASDYWKGARAVVKDARDVAIYQRDITDKNGSKILNDFYTVPESKWNQYLPSTREIFDTLQNDVKSKNYLAQDCVDAIRELYQLVSNHYTNCNRELSKRFEELRARLHPTPFKAKAHLTPYDVIHATTSCDRFFSRLAGTFAKWEATEAINHRSFYGREAGEAIKAVRVEPQRCGIFPVLRYNSSHFSNTQSNAFFDFYEMDPLLAFRDPFPIIVVRGFLFILFNFLFKFRNRFQVPEAFNASNRIFPEPIYLYRSLDINYCFITNENLNKVHYVKFGGLEAFMEAFNTGIANSINSISTVDIADIFKSASEAQKAAPTRDQIFDARVEKIKEAVEEVEITESNVKESSADVKIAKLNLVQSSKELNRAVLKHQQAEWAAQKAVHQREQSMKEIAPQPNLQELLIRRQKRQQSRWRVMGQAREICDTAINPLQQRYERTCDQADRKRRNASLQNISLRGGIRDTIVKSRDLSPVKKAATFVCLGGAAARQENISEVLIKLEAEEVAGKIRRALLTESFEQSLKEAEAARGDQEKIKATNAANVSKAGVFLPFSLIESSHPVTLFESKSGITLIDPSHFSNNQSNAFFDFYEIDSLLSSRNPFTPIAVRGFLFILFNLLFKLTAAPFHFWAPSVYGNAPIASVTFLSIYSKVRVFFFIYSLLTGFLHFSSQRVLFLFFFSGLLSILVGRIGAFTEKRTKRFFVFSSRGHVGFRLAGYAVSTFEGYTSVFHYLPVYRLSSFLRWFILFSRAPAKSGQSSYLIHLATLKQKFPYLALFFAFLLFSRSGIPPFAGFFVKLDILSALFDSSQFFLNYIFFFFTVASFFYYLRAIKILFFDASSVSSVNGAIISTIPNFSVAPSDETPRSTEQYWLRSAIFLFLSFYLFLIQKPLFILQNERLFSRRRLLFYFFLSP